MPISIEKTDSFILNHFLLYYAWLSEAIGGIGERGTFYYSDYTKLTVKRLKPIAHILYMVFGVGIISALLAWTAAIVTSFLRHNALSFIDLIREFWNIPKRDDYQDEHRNFFGKYIWGLPGTLLAFPIGTIGANFVSLWHFTKKSFRFLNQEEGNEGNNEDNRNWFIKYVLGFVGTSIGFVFGSIAANACAIPKGSVEGFNTLGIFSIPQEENRQARISVFQTIVSIFLTLPIRLPVWILGEFCGFVSTNAFVLLDMTYMTYGFISFDDNNNYGPRFIPAEAGGHYQLYAGIPAMIIGAIIGFLIANIRSFPNGFVDGFVTLGTINYALNQITPRKILSIPGRLPGWILGGIGGFFQINGLSFWYSAKKIFFFLTEGNTPYGLGHLYWFKKYILGVLGIVIGAIPGLLMANVYAIGIGVGEGYKMLVASQAEPLKVPLFQKVVSIFFTFPFRLLGWILGGIAGIFYINAILFYDTIKALFPSLDTQSKKHEWYEFILGAAGALFGCILGLFARGIYIAFTKNITEIEKNFPQPKGLTKKDKDDLKKNLNSVLENDAANNFFDSDTNCSISHQLADNPVMDKSGHVYDYKVIDKWLKKDPANPTNPFDRSPMNITELAFFDAPVIDIFAKLRTYHAEGSSSLKKDEKSPAPSEEAIEKFANIRFLLQMLKRPAEFKLDDSENSKIIRNDLIALNTDLIKAIDQRLVQKIQDPKTEITDSLVNELLPPEEDQKPESSIVPNNNNVPAPARQDQKSNDALDFIN